MTHNTDNTPNVWIGCLSCYPTALIGEWFDAAEAGEVTVEQVHGGRDTGHEELWVMDHENFGEWLKGECSPAEAQALAERMDSLGDDAEPFILWARHIGADPLEAEEDAFRDVYHGALWDSLEEYAESLVEDGVFGKVPESLRNHIDYASIARDLDAEGYWIEKTHVFGP